MKKCPNLKELEINAIGLPKTLLLDIKTKYGIDLILDKFTEKSLKKYQKMPVGLQQSEKASDINLDPFILPEKILLKVFSCFSTQDILQNIALVCKQFHKITKNPSLYKSVTFKNIDEDDLNSVEIFLKKATKLQELTLKKSIQKQEILLTKALQSCPELKTIRTWSKVTKDLAQAMLNHGTQIEKLDFKFSYQKPDFETFVTLTKIKNLRSFKFYLRHVDFQPKHLEAIASNCQNIEYLGLPCIASLPENVLEDFYGKMKNRLCKIYFQLHSGHPTVFIFQTGTYNSEFGHKATFIIF